jgi:hypothetical protein
MMKKLSIIATLFLMSISATLFYSCGKDGAPGAQGPQGATGNANVIASVGNTTASSWVFNSTYNEWDATFNVSVIDPSVMAGGTVQAFLGDGTGAQWSALPLPYHTSQINYTYLLGQVMIEITNSDGSAPSAPGVYQFKFVVIPPAAMKAHPKMNWKDYTAIKAVCNL